MPNRKPPVTDDELIKAVADAFDQIEPETPSEIDAVLREAGHDPERVATEFKALAEQELEQSPLNWRKRARAEMEKEKTRLEGFEPSTLVPVRRADLIAAIQKLMSQLGSNTDSVALAHFRNFDQATDEDLASMLTELEYLATKTHTSDDTNKD